MYWNLCCNTDQCDALSSAPWTQCQISAEGSHIRPLKLPWYKNRGHSTHCPVLSRAVTGDATAPSSSMDLKKKQGYRYQFNTAELLISTMQGFNKQISCRCKDSIISDIHIPFASDAPVTKNPKKTQTNATLTKDVEEVKFALSVT